MAHADRNMVPLYLTEGEREQLDLYAEIAGISRQKLLEAIISSALDDLDFMDRTGLLIEDVRMKDQIEMFKKIPAEHKLLVAQAVNSCDGDNTN